MYMNGSLAKKVEGFWQHSALPLFVVFEHTMNFIKSYCVYSEYIGNREPWHPGHWMSWQFWLGLFTHQVFKKRSMPPRVVGTWGPKRQDLQECAQCAVYLVTLLSVWRHYVRWQPPTAVPAKAKADIANESVQSQSLLLLGADVTVISFQFLKISI